MLTMREIVIDTETTGLDPLDGHRVVEIGALKLINRSEHHDAIVGAGGLTPINNLCVAAHLLFRQVVDVSDKLPTQHMNLFKLRGAHYHLGLQLYQAI
jgi:DNA polymerase III epsilon subunit-like protein